MGTIGIRTIIDPPRQLPWRGGLYSAASAVGMLFENDDGRWTQGVAYRRGLPYLRTDDAVGPGSYIACPVDAGGVDETGQSGKAVRRDTEANVEWDPYPIYDADGCTTLDSTFGEARARSERSLRLQSSHLVEQVLWTGDVNGLDFTVNHPNTALASADAVLPNGSTALGVVSAMELMIGTLADTLGGQRAMIHIPASLLSLFDFYGQVNRVQDLLTTFAADHVIVAGTGYPGTDPDGASEAGVTWIYGTSLVELRLSTVFVPSDAPTSAAYDRSLNDVDVVAERMALAHFDRAAHIGIPVCTPDPGPDCPAVS